MVREYAHSSFQIGNVSRFIEITHNVLQVCQVQCAGFRFIEKGKRNGLAKKAQKIQRIVFDMYLVMNDVFLKI